MRRGGFLKRTTRLKPMSDKRKDSLSTRKDVRVAVLARDGGCRGRLIVSEVQCRGALDYDEIVNRGRKPGGELDPDNVQALCRAHHDWKGANPVEAERRGLWFSAGNDGEWAQHKEEARQVMNDRWREQLPGGG